MMWRTKWGAGDEPCGWEVEAGHRMHPGGLQCRHSVKGREQARKASGQHGLSRAGRPDHQQVMPSGSGNLQCAAGQRLPSDIGQIDGPRAVVGSREAGPSVFTAMRTGTSPWGSLPWRRSPRGSPRQSVNQLAQGGAGSHIASTGESGLPRAFVGHHQPVVPE